MCMVKLIIFVSMGKQNCYKNHPAELLSYSANKYISVRPLAVFTEYSNLTGNTSNTISPVYMYTTILC